MVLDSKDRALLKMLQHDAKQTNKQLSLQLDLSVTAVYERIKKLEREGVITSYVTLLDKEKVQKGFTVFCHIKLVQHAQDYLTKFEKEVTSLDEVLECFHVSGDYDYLLKVAVVVTKQNLYFTIIKSMYKC